MSTPETPTTYTGGCLCGAVRFELKVKPNIAAVCYCLSCRKLSGAGHAFHAIIPESALTVTGETRGYQWKADSGKTNTTSFCPTCGSPLFGKSDGIPGMMTLRVAALDDPTILKPQLAVFTKRLLPWDHLDPKLHAFQEMPPIPGL